MSTTAMDMHNLSWKVEPMSPDLDNLDVETETWLFNDDDVAEQFIPVKDELPEVPSPSSRAEVAARLLEDLDDWIKEEPFPEWMEEKGNHGVFFESLPLETSDLAIPEAVKKLPVEHKEEVSDTPFLLQEFQSIYDQIEQTNASLTPPLSPTLPPYTNVYNSFVVDTPQQLGSLQFIQVTPVVPFTYADSKDQFVVPVSFAEKKLEDPLLASLEQIVPSSPSTDLVHEMTVVDELVRMCADEMVPNVESGSTPGKAWVEKVEQASPIPSSGDLEPEVDYSYPLSPGMSSSSCSSDEDPDFGPDPVSYRSGTTSKVKRGKKRSSRGHTSGAPDEKKMRKKEQNKNAATRYRRKKKAEVEEILGEEKELEDKNEELNKQAEDLSREIRYLKGFMRDIFKAKGLIKS